MAEQEKQGHFWIYVWLGVSGLLNLSGMASIADGFVVWAKFFHDIIDVYRAVIRQPLAWVGHFIWPFGPIPGWVLDAFVIWAALILSVNIWTHRTGRGTLIGLLRRAFQSKDHEIIIAALTLALFPPMFILTGFFTNDKVRFASLNILVNFLILIATFTLLLFINWQIRQHGG